MIGIIGAMDMEVDGLKEKMSSVTVESIGGSAFYQGVLCGVPCVVARCGEGKVNAAMCAQTMALQFQTSILINIGVAGGIGKGVCVGDLVISNGLVQHDFDLSDLGYQKGLITNLEKAVIPATPMLTSLTAHVAREVYDGNVHIGIIATGDQFIASRDKLLDIHSTFHAMACEMEGAAIAQVCLLNQIDFVVIRAISDNADEKADVSFEQFAPMAAQKSIDLMLKLIPAINTQRGVSL